MDLVLKYQFCFSLFLFGLVLIGVATDISYHGKPAGIYLM